MSTTITFSLHHYTGGEVLRTGAEDDPKGAKRLSGLTLTSANDRCSRAVAAQGGINRGQCVVENGVGGKF